MQLASTYQRFLSAERPERKRQALQRRTHRQSRTVELPAQRLEGAECGRPESRLDPYGAQVDVMKTTRRRSSVTTRCTSRALTRVQWDGRCHSLSLKAVDQLGIGGGGRSNACVDFLKGRLRPRSAVKTALAAPSRSPAMCLCVGSRARTGCRLTLPV